MNRIQLNKESVINFALHQLDNLGYELQRRGISGQVNRHNLAALAMTKQQQLKGEMARYELRIGMQRAKLEKASGLPVIGSISHVLTAAQRQIRKKRMRYFYAGFGGLFGAFGLLMAIEFVQRGMVA